MANQIFIVGPEDQQKIEDHEIIPQLWSYYVASGSIITQLLPECWQQGSLKCHGLWPQQTEVALGQK